MTGLLNKTDLEKNRQFFSIILHFHINCILHRELQGGKGKYDTSKGSVPEKRKGEQVNSKKVGFDR